MATSMEISIENGKKFIAKCYEPGDVPMLIVWKNRVNGKTMYLNTAHLFEDSDTLVFLTLNHKKEIMSMLWEKYGKHLGLKNDSTYTLVDVVDEMFDSPCNDYYTAGNMWGYTGTFGNFRSKDDKMFQTLRKTIEGTFGVDAYKMVVINKSKFKSYGCFPSFLDLKFIKVTVN